MAQPQRRAEFFVRPDGVCFAKARPLKERERFGDQEEFRLLLFPLSGIRIVDRAIVGAP